MKALNYVAIFLVALLVSFTAQAQQYSKITYVHSDPDGTAFAATNEEGNVEWKIEHFPFGREFENTSQERKNDISFAGKPYDDEIGLSYFGARWYDPDLGRFTGIDPMPVQENDYETFNRYAYGFNNPYKYVDPDGNFAFLIPVAIFLAKEIAAEAASRATGGATDFLSVRRSGTKLIKGGVSLLNKKKKNDLCFVEGTPVHTQNGLQSIESIVIGDLVLSKNDFTGKPIYKRVTQTYINDDKEILDIEFDNQNEQTETFGITKEHPVWVIGKGWVDAGQLKAGDKVDSLNGRVSVVKQITQRPQNERTYNIEVEDYHTYFVGDSGLWVHNMCGGNGGADGGNVAGSGSDAAKKGGKEYGSYTNTHESGKKYHGQGDRKRSQKSGRERSAENNDTHTATDWTPAPNRREAMKDEARRLSSDGGKGSSSNYNKINSPGKKYRKQDGD